MEAWSVYLQKLRAELGGEVVDKWLTPLNVVRFDAANLYLEAKDHFQALWFEEHIRKRVASELKNNNSRPIKLHLSVKGVSKPARKNRRTSQEELTQEFSLRFDELDPLQTFTHYHPTEENLLPYKLLQETIQNSQSSADEVNTKELIAFNPIYIHGSAGSGKTHLLVAAAAEFKRLGVKAIYCRAETFTSHVVSAIRAGEMSLFRQIYRSADVLIIDGVHAFSKKGATQEELFHTFNALHLEGKQIILSAHCPPAELQHIEPRLVSRFEWGIVLPLLVPQDVALKEVFEAKLKAFDLKLPKKSVETLMQTFRPNMKSYVKAAQALILRSEDADAETLSPKVCKELLKDLIAEESRAEVTPDHICWAVADMYGITVEDIKGKSQKRDSALPRQISMFLCRDRLKMPYTRIGEHFQRDHSTVISSIRKVEERITDGQPELVSTLHSLMQKLDYA